MEPVPPPTRVDEIREETPADVASIRVIHEEAFGQKAEADLVDGLRENGRVAVSVVAHHEDHIVGHLLLSHATIVGDDDSTPCLALAPVAVAPEKQNRGIGMALVRRGLELARERGHGVVVVLGHPTYYPRFGFEPGATKGIRCPYEAPDDAFLVLGLQPGALDGVSGLVQYAPEFAGV